MGYGQYKAYKRGSLKLITSFTDSILSLSLYLSTESLSYLSLFILISLTISILSLSLYLSTESLSYLSLFILISLPFTVTISVPGARASFVKPVDRSKITDWQKVRDTVSACREVDHISSAGPFA